MTKCDFYILDIDSVYVMETRIFKTKEQAELFYLREYAPGGVTPLTPDKGPIYTISGHDFGDVCG